MSSWSPTLPAISAENFSQASEIGSVVVILLWAVWDPGSRSLDARLTRAAEGYANLRFYAMDLDLEQNWPIAKEWGIMNTPSLVCLVNGVFQELLTGSRPELLLSAKLADWNSLTDQ